MRDHGADIAGEEVLALAETDDQRAAEPRANDQVGHIQVHHRDPVGSLDLC